MSRRRKVSQLRLLASGSSGRKITLVGDGLAGDPQRGHEADPVRVVPGVGGCLGHERADRVVAAQVSPDLLEYQVGRLRAQHGARSALVGLEFVEGQLNLPPLCVGGGESYRVDLIRVEPRGEGLPELVALPVNVFLSPGQAAATCSRTRRLIS